MDMQCANLLIKFHLSNFDPIKNESGIITIFITAYKYLINNKLPPPEIKL